MTAQNTLIIGDSISPRADFIILWKYQLYVMGKSDIFLMSQQSSSALALLC